MNLQGTTPFEFVVFSIIFFNVVLSMMSFGNYRRFEQLKFHIGSILGGKQYYRIISSAFIHGDWMHLGLNMFVLYSFSINSLSDYVSIPLFLGIYFSSLLIGNLLPLYIKRNQSYYSAVGASGAVSGILYASIYFNPFGFLYLFGMIEMWKWLFGILYLVYTVWASKKANDNVGHEAHFGGALTGLVVAFFINPSIAFEYWWIILAMMAPIAYFLLTMTNTPDLLSKFKRFDNDSPNYSNRKIDDLYNYSRSKKEAELNSLLEKINKKGIDSLSNYEKERLDDLSQDLK